CMGRAVLPRDGAKLDGNEWPGCGPRTTLLGWASVKCAPPSVDFQTPTPGVPGGICETAPAVVEEMPCTPRPEVTYIVFRLLLEKNNVIVCVPGLVDIQLPR